MIEEGLLLPMNVLLQGQKLTLLDPEMWFLRGNEKQINSFEDLPVKIEFVLGKKIMNLYEIDDLCAKRIISLLPEAEKNIEIRVNGALTGYGELVEVDDKLGVEIHSWLSGNNNVK